MEEVNIFSHQPTYSSRSDAYARTADFSFGLRDIESIGATCLHELLRRVPSVTVELGEMLCTWEVQLWMEKDQPLLP